MAGSLCQACEPCPPFSGSPAAWFVEFFIAFLLCQAATVTADLDRNTPTCQTGLGQ